MASAVDLPTVEIDGRGTFKYVLISVKGQPSNVEGKTDSMYIVRGDKDSDYHADVFEKCENFVHTKKLKLKLKCVGGGRITHDPEKKHILVYGYSMGYGRADHEITQSLLQKHYKDYTVEWNNDGY